MQFFLLPGMSGDEFFKSLGIEVLPRSEPNQRTHPVGDLDVGMQTGSNPNSAPYASTFGGLAQFSVPKP